MSNALLELIAKKKADIAAQSVRQRAANIPANTSEWRILPGWRGEADPQFWHDFGQHFVKDKAGKVQAVYVCTDKTFGRPCQVCDAITSALHSVTDDETSKLVKEAVAGGRVLVNALHVDGPEPNKVQVLSLPPTVFAEIIELMNNWGKEGVNILSLAEGHDITFNKTGTGLNTRYTVSAKPRPRPVPDSIIGQLNNLDNYVAQESEEQARRAISSVRATAGLIGAPAPAAAALPKPSALAEMMVDDDPTLDIGKTYVAPAAAPAATAAPAVVDVAFEEVKTAPAAAAPAASTGDSELDSLLSELNG